jgi:hypothetical protein
MRKIGNERGEAENEPVESKKSAREDNVLG